MRLNAEQWAAIRAEHEADGATFGELADKYGVNKSNISRRAKKEGWNQAETQWLIDATVENEKQNLILRNETQHLNATTQQAVQRAVFDRLAFELQNNADMQAVRDKAIAMLPGTDKVSDVESVMRIIKMQREAHLGKSPDTQVNIQNNNGGSAIDALHARRLGDGA